MTNSHTNSLNQSTTESIKTGDNNLLKEKLIKEHSLADSKTESGISLLQYAVYCRNKEAIDLIIKYKNLDLDIFEATSVGHNKTVKKLLVENPELLNTFSIDGFTLLGLASYFGHFHLVKFLLEKGSDPNTPSNNQFRVAPLHSACSISNYEIAELLIINGANVNARQLHDYTPLHSAAHNDKIELARLLINNGADVNAKTYDRKTPLSIALEKGFKELADLIVNYGGKL
jgi:ankyrin repeat protein